MGSETECQRSQDCLPSVQKKRAYYLGGCVSTGESPIIDIKTERQRSKYWYAARLCSLRCWRQRWNSMRCAAGLSTTPYLSLSLARYASFISFPSAGANLLEPCHELIKPGQFGTSMAGHQNQVNAVSRCDRSPPCPVCNPKTAPANSEPNRLETARSSTSSKVLSTSSGSPLRGFRPRLYCRKLVRIAAASASAPGRFQDRKKPVLRTPALQSVSPDVRRKSAEAPFRRGPQSEMFPPPKN